MNLTPGQVKGLLIIMLLVIGYAFGRGSVEPEVIETDKVVEIPAPTPEPQVVEVDNPYVPQACLDAVTYAERMVSVSTGLTDVAPQLTDTMELVRKSIASGDAQYSVEAQSILRRTDQTILNGFMRAEQLRAQYDDAVTECKELL